jgi:hypothetical protein
MVEVRPTVSFVSRWRVPNQGPLAFETLTDTDQANEIAQLDTAFASYANSLGDAMRVLAQFVVGLVHNENRAILSTDDEVVDALAISDGCLDLWTHTREWLFEIRCRVKSLWVDTEWGGEELEIEMHGYHEFYGSVTESPGQTWHRDLPAQRPFSDRPHLTLPWYRVGMWPVEEIYQRDAAGAPIQSLDGNGNPATFPNGQPCYELRQDPFLIGVNVRVVEHGPFTDDYLIPASYPGPFSDLPPDQPVWYGNESQWATREFFVYLRSWDPTAGETPCTDESRLEELIRTDTAGLVSEVEAQAVVLGVNGTGYYALPFEMRLYAR